MADPLTEAQREQVSSALFAGKKIEAIKAYRAAAGADLVTAKGAVEAMEAELRAAAPEKFSAAAPAKAGCMGMLLLILMPALLIAWTKL